MKKSGGTAAAAPRPAAASGKGKKAPKKPPLAGPTIPPANVGPTGIVPAEGVRLAAKALGLADLGQGVAAFVAQSAEYQLREVIEDAIKVSQGMAGRFFLVVCVVWVEWVEWGLMTSSNPTIS